MQQTEPYTIDSELFVRMLASKSSMGLKQIYFRLYARWKFGVNGNLASNEEVLEMIARDILKTETKRRYE